MVYLKVGVLCLLLLLNDALSQDVRDILADSQQARSQISSVRVRYKSKIWMKRGAVYPAEVAGVDVPQDDTTVEYDCELLLSRGMLRHSVKGEMWSSDDNGFIEQERIYVWDGESSLDFYNSAKAPYAFIRSDNDYLNSIELMPLVFAFRTVTAGVNPDSFDARAKATSIGGVDCLVLTSRSTRKTIAEYTLAKLDGYPVYRMHKINTDTGQLLSEIVVNYETTNSLHFHSPKSWTISEYLSNGEPEQIISTDVVSTELNVVIPDLEFSYDLPPGVIVSDDRLRGKEGADYMVTEGGQTRIITKEEAVRGATREEIASTPQGRAGLDRRVAKGTPWAYWGIGAFVLASAVIIFWLKGRR